MSWSHHSLTFLILECVFPLYMAFEHVLKRSIILLFPRVFLNLPNEVDSQIARYSRYSSVNYCFKQSCHKLYQIRLTRLSAPIAPGQAVPETSL